MEVNVSQVHELNKKFEVLNEEIALALRQQEDAISSTAVVTGSNAATATPRKDVLKLTTRAINWREDVNALAKHIDLQLQNSRALRSKEAEVLSRDGDSKAAEDDDSAKLRCLRSDLRLLQSFRLSHVHAAPGGDAKDFTAHLEAMDAEGKHQKDLVDQSLKAEKSGRKEVLAAMVIQLFEARRELMGKISEEILKNTKQIDLDSGLSDILAAPGNLGSRSDGDKDMLASWDAQLYLRLVHGLLDLEKKLKERFTDAAFAPQSPAVSIEHAREDKQEEASTRDSVGIIMTPFPAISHGNRPSDIVSPTSGQVASLDEVNFALQKLRRDHVDLKHAHSKLAIANAQLEDDLAHLQRKYDDEKRAHVNEKRWYLPKIQKLEETVLTTSKAFEALKLNVELLTNMYKALKQTLVTHELEENELKLERNRVTALLADEIKKVALLAKENARKEKLVTIAMSARHEMCAIAKHSESRMKALEQEKNALEQRAKEQSEEASVLKLQLDSAYNRLEVTDNALRSAKATIERLQNEIEVCVEAGRVKEVELKSVFDKEMQTLQQRFDKTKRELMDAMSQNLSLDGRLRKAQDKLNKIAGGDSAKATKDGTTVNS